MTLPFNLPFNPDIVNGLLEFSGALFLGRNALLLYRDKVAKGVSKLSTSFFTGWGIWNLLYYPSLNQMYSFAGGVAIVLTNATWLALMWKYRNSTVLTTVTSTVTTPTAAPVLTTPIEEAAKLLTFDEFCAQLDKEDQT